MQYEAWDRRLQEAERQLGFSQGYKFVYGPWSTLENARIAFLSLNPGNAPDDILIRTLSDERGNSYEVERCSTRSPLTEQFLRLANLLGVFPNEILTGAVAPFRSENWDGLSKRQKSESLALGRQFWLQPLRQSSLRLIFTCSSEAARLVTEITQARLDFETPARWHNIKLRRYRTPSGQIIVQLPHLSRFRLLSRPESEHALRMFLDEIWENGQHRLS